MTGLRKLLTCITVSAVGFVTADSTALSREMQDRILVERAQNGYRLRYQDPDFDNEWREYDVPDANRLFVSMTVTVKPYTPGLWVYEYSPDNSLDSQQNLVSWSVQAAYGAQVLTPPFGWRASEDRLSIVSWTSTEPPGLRPGETLSGWSIVSDNLPVVRQARGRGASSPDVGLADLPTAVKTRVAELEEHNVVTMEVLAPGIQTQIITLGQESIRDPKDILNEARQCYPEWLRAATVYADLRRAQVRGASSSDAEWAARVSDQLAQASTLLENDRSVARTYLRDWLRTLAKEKREDPWLDSIRSALVLVLEHVVDRLR